MINHTTIDGFKRAAKVLKNDLGIPLHQAQEILARKEGYPSYYHTQRTLKRKPTGFETTFFQNWTKERRSGKGGCFKASVWTKTNPLEILTPHARRHFMTLYKEPKKSLYRVHGTAECEQQAQWYVGRCLRFMQFCDATKLTPGASDFRRDPGSRNRCPWSDHRRHWWDRENKAYIISDEPFASRLSEWLGRTDEWGNVHGYDTQELNWGSIYSPNTHMVLFCRKDSGVDLQNLEEKLIAVGTPLYLDEG